MSLKKPNNLSLYLEQTQLVSLQPQHPDQSLHSMWPVSLLVVQRSAVEAERSSSSWSIGSFRQLGQDYEP